MSDKPITFLASFPAIQSAVKVSGNGEGLRLTLDVPESEMANAIGLLAMRDKVLKVTVELNVVKRDITKSKDFSLSGDLSDG